MSIKDILAVLFAVDRDEPALQAAEVLSTAFRARATALLVEVQPDPMSPVDGYVMSEVYAQILENAHKAFVIERQALAKRLLRQSEPFDIRDLAMNASLGRMMLGSQSRHADLTIMTQQTSVAQDDVRRIAFEGALFGSGRPVLLVPRAWKQGPIGENVVIAWNASRESARALADAADLVDKAKRVAIVTVDARPSIGGHGLAPGADVAAHLARRGVQAELRNIASQGRTEEAVLIHECASLGADLLVMGGYGRARLQEMIFGGVTRALTKSSPLPLWLSH